MRALRNKQVLFLMVWIACAIGVGAGAYMYYKSQKLLRNTDADADLSALGSSVAEFEGGAMTLTEDSGRLFNASSDTKLLYQIEINAPDPEAVIDLIHLHGTELGEGSFVRVKSVGLVAVYNRFQLENARYIISCGPGNVVVLELWGAPKTHNRLRVNRILYFYPGRPIQREEPTGAPIPASGGL